MNESFPKPEIDAPVVERDGDALIPDDVQDYLHLVKLTEEEEQERIEYLAESAEQEAEEQKRLRLEISKDNADKVIMKIENANSETVSNVYLASATSDLGAGLMTQSDYERVQATAASKEYSLKISNSYNPDTPTGWLPYKD